MARKLLIKIIASLCLAKGLWDLGDLLYPFFFLFAPVEILHLIAGVLEIYAGIYLFRLSETGRKILLTLLSIQAVAAAFFIVWALFFWKDGNGSAIYYFDEKIFTSENRLISAGLTSIFLVVPLVIISFLSQEKTKILFAQEAISNADSETFIEPA